MRWILMLFAVLVNVPASASYIVDICRGDSLACNATPPYTVYDYHVHAHPFGNMSGANLYFAELDSMDLRYTDLSGADLRRAILWSADLSRSDLSSANMSGAGVSGVRGLRFARV